MQVISLDGGKYLSLVVLPFAKVLYHIVISAGSAKYNWTEMPLFAFVKQKLSCGMMSDIVKSTKVNVL